MKQDYQQQHDVEQGTTSGTPQNNLANQGVGNPNQGNMTAPVTMVQGKDGIGGSTSGMGK
jgi:hypothetical protein